MPLARLDEPPGKLDPHAMLPDTLAVLEQLPQACARFREHLPFRAHPTPSMIEAQLRNRLDTAEVYNMVPGPDPRNG